MSHIQMKNVSKIFDGKTRAVDNITLDIVDTEFMVIVGPSGCGKTTTLRLISGLEDITSGSISMDDKTVNHVHPKDRDVAMVFQNYALYPHMTAFENMAFGLKLRKYAKKEIRNRVEETAKLLSITDLLSKKPHVLSGGQRQRVAMGRAIVRKPKAFLFDEPLSNLDPTLRLATRLELKALHQKLRTTSIYVTHDQTEAMALGDRLAVMHQGRILQVGKPIDVYNRPSNRFVAGFVGTPSMNFLDGIIRYQDDGIYFAVDTNMIPLPSHFNKLLGPYKNTQTVLGVRPEHIRLKPIAGETKYPIACSVEAIEALGDQTHIYFQKNDSNRRLIAKVDHKSKLRVSQKVDVFLETDYAHVFEPGETGLNIGVKCPGCLNQS